MTLASSGMIEQWVLFVAIVGLFVAVGLPLLALSGIAWKGADRLAKMDANTEAAAKSLKEVQAGVARLGASLDQAVNEIRHIDGRLVAGEQRAASIDNHIRDHERRLGAIEERTASRVGGE